MRNHNIVASLALAALVSIGGGAVAEQRFGLTAQGSIAFSNARFGLDKSALQTRLTPAAAPIAAAALPVRPPTVVTRGGGVARPFTASTGAAWMHSDVPTAWAAGYTGLGATITVVDSFSTTHRLQGNMAGMTQVLSHGAWTSKQAGMVAVDARIVTKDFNTGTRAVTLQSGFNVMNLSYGIYFARGTGAVNWAAQERSLIGFAQAGSAVVVKAAGNDSVAIGAVTRTGRVDLLARDLVGRQSAIFVGALTDNGAVARPAALASYSNTAGTNVTVQNQFLVVGVKNTATGLAGTSFAAPIVSGYAAIVQSKFTSATPAQVASQLLTTARKDTIARYSPAIHGRGEASLSRALAPAAIR